MSCKKSLAMVAAITSVALASPAAHARYFFNFQTPVTPIAKGTLYIHDLFLAIITILFVLVLAILLYSIFTHRKSRGYKPASFTKPANTKQWIFTIIPFLALVFIDFVILGIPAFRSVLEMADTHHAAMVVKVTASQWKWHYEYPAYGIKFDSVLSTPQDEIYGNAPKDKHFLLEVNHPFVLPTHEKIRIVLASNDVIHSFWVPAFGIKKDVVPGFLRTTWVNIEKPGVYRGQCAELCGVGHAFMPIVVKAVSQQEFKMWVAQMQTEQKVQQAAVVAESTKTFTEQELIAKGKKVFDNNCAACHQADGLGIQGTFPPIAAGHPFSASPQMIADLTKLGFCKDGKIVMGPVEHHIHIVLHGIPGTPMPPFGPHLSDVDVAAVVTYERNSFGNHTGDVIQSAQVQAARTSQ